MPTTATVVAAVAGAALGAVVGATIVYTALTAAGPFDTARPTIKTKTDHTIANCPPFTAQRHPTRMYQVELRSSPLNIYDLQPAITEMDVTAAPYTAGDPNTAQAYTGPTTWVPSTPLDMSLDLAPSGTSGKHNLVLIKILVDDPRVQMVAYPFTVISNDANKKMFCKFAGGWQTNAMTFAVEYYKPNANKTYGSYSVGLIVTTASGQKFPIYLDPEVQNEG